MDAEGAQENLDVLDEGLQDTERPTIGSEEYR